MKRYKSFLVWVLLFIASDYGVMRAVEKFMNEDILAIWFDWLVDGPIIAGAFPVIICIWIGRCVIR